MRRRLSVTITLESKEDTLRVSIDDFMEKLTLAVGEILKGYGDEVEIGQYSSYKKPE